MGMMAEKAVRAGRHLLPWSGAIGAGFGWILSQHTGSYQSFDNCTGSGPLMVLLTGLAGLAITAAGIWFVLPVWRERGSVGGAAPFIAGMGMGLAALCAVAIILQTAAALLIPRCYG